jgi:hypothetical protein
VYTIYAIPVAEEFFDECKNDSWMDEMLVWMMQDIMQFLTQIQMVNCEEGMTIEFAVYVSQS